MHVISTWVALLVPHLAYIWSLVRYACFNCFGSRNIKSSLMRYYDPRSTMILIHNDMHSIYTWIALHISYLANVWSQVRYMCSNYFDFRNIKPSLEFCKRADTSIIVYSNTSDKECERQHIAEWGEVNSEPFGYSISEPFPPQDRLEDKRYTFKLRTCDHILDILLENDYIRILDHNIVPSLQGQVYCKLHDSFDHSIDNCNMFYQIVQSAVDIGRFKLVDMQVEDQTILVDNDGHKLLHRLLPADLSQHEQVYNKDDGIKPTSEEIVEEHIKNILEGESSIESTTKTSSTRGQQENSKIDACRTKREKGHDKHRKKKSKVTSAQLVEKYQKKNEAKKDRKSVV